MNRNGELDPVKQTTGQLMGSTLSFPILCAVNLVCYWKTLETFLGRKVAARQLPVIVNGDDILFRCNEEFYKLWLVNIREVGFELSIGKNYVSKSFLTVNSTGFLWNGSSFREIGYLNTGLLTGQSKLSARAETATSPIWSYYNQVIHGAVDPVRAHRRFLHYHKSNIAKFTNDGQYNLFLDPLYGGLGFELDPSVETAFKDDEDHTRGPLVRFTPFQRAFGNFLRRFNEQPYDGEFDGLKPFRGIVVPSPTKMPTKHVYHFGHYKISPRMAPLRENERLALDPDQTLASALMSFSIMSRQADEVVSIKPVDRALLRLFRNGETESHGHLRKLLHNDSVWVEVY
jgi:hypothetical protein